MAASVTLWKLSVSGAWTYFVYDRSWIRPWIKSISNELDITFYVLAPQLSRRVPLCVRIVFFIASYRFIMLYKNRIIYVLLWRTIYVVTPVLWLYSFPPSLRNYWYTMKQAMVLFNNAFFSYNVLNAMRQGARVTDLMVCNTIIKWWTYVLI